MINKYVPISEKPKETLSATKNKGIWGGVQLKFHKCIFCKMPPGEGKVGPLSTKKAIAFGASPQTPLGGLQCPPTPQLFVNYAQALRACATQHAKACYC